MSSSLLAAPKLKVQCDVLARKPAGSQVQAAEGEPWQPGGTCAVEHSFGMVCAVCVLVTGLGFA